MAKTTDNITIVASDAEWKVMYSNMKMTKKTIGNTSVSRSRART
jgi:hypothetical protein